MWLLTGRGLLRAELGDLRGALADQLETGRLAERHGVVNPAMMPWRSRAAIAAARLGETAEAQRLAAEEVDLARQWGTRRVVGCALAALGRVNRDAELLAEAADLLAQSSDRLAFAEANFHLGVALRSARRSGEARTALTRAHRLATDIGATQLARQAKDLLDRIAARRPAGTPATSLTTQERHIAERAAAGATSVTHSKTTDSGGFRVRQGHVPIVVFREQRIRRAAEHRRGAAARGRRAAPRPVRAPGRPCDAGLCHAPSRLR
ncbi:hypothetical protein [Amycolatopsis sp. GM8]|uniref:hypothetical protein n=1 Tax=Amycolatopsis sp. GM8 TaxID=2896530 RepID=UPI001F32E8FA|nr:hypothetical protein [Amycolatopsis sp. GM8]